MQPTAPIEQHSQASEIVVSLTSVTHVHPTPADTWRDGLGIAASVMCAIHCAVMPFVVGYLPLLGLSFFAEPEFHQWMVVVCLGLAVLAFVPGLRRHRKLAPSLVAAIGLSMIAAAAFAGEDYCCPTSGTHESGAVHTASANTPKTLDSTKAATCESTGCGSCVSSPQQTKTVQLAALGGVWPWVTPFGGCLLVVAHLFNRRLICLCSRCDNEDDA